MIEPLIRNERLAVELADLTAGVLLFDLVLGFGSHDDPAGVLADGVGRALKKNPRLVAIASITGTDLDPQGFAAQQQKLEDAGLVVMPDNRAAALLAAAVLKPALPKPKRSRRVTKPHKKVAKKGGRR